MQWKDISTYKYFTEENNANCPERLLNLLASQSNKNPKLLPFLSVVASIAKFLKPKPNIYHLLKSMKEEICRKHKHLINNIMLIDLTLKLH